ncbi:MAG: hypothetical protein KIT27_04670 [Legionellales bacterium]|nr:hypothetical protein [Legionellales bacterium]
MDSAVRTYLNRAAQEKSDFSFGFPKWRFSVSNHSPSIDRVLSTKLQERARQFATIREPYAPYTFRKTNGQYFLQAILDEGVSMEEVSTVLDISPKSMYRIISGESSETNYTIFCRILNYYCHVITHQDDVADPQN